MSILEFLDEFESDIATHRLHGKQSSQLLEPCLSKKLSVNILGNGISNHHNTAIVLIGRLLLMQQHMIGRLENTVEIM